MKAVFNFLQPLRPLTGGEEIESEAREAVTWESSQHYGGGKERALIKGQRGSLGGTTGGDSEKGPWQRQPQSLTCLEP